MRNIEVRGSSVLSSLAFIGAHATHKWNDVPPNFECHIISSSNDGECKMTFQFHDSSTLGDELWNFICKPEPRSPSGIQRAKQRAI